MGELSIGLALSHELESLADIERAAAGLFPPGRIDDPNEVLPLSVRQLAQQQGLLWVARAPSAIAGFALTERVDDWLHLEEVSVHPQYGRRGIGRALVVQVIDHAQQQRLRGVSLTTFADIAWNAPFYAKLGFREGLTELPGAIINKLEAERSAGLTHRILMTLSLPH